jgi:hypothetical protein
MWGRLTVALIGFWLVFAGWEIEPELAAMEPDEQFTPEMGSFIQIWDDAGSNGNPVVTYNPLHDEYLVVWVTVQDQFTSDIWGRRLRSDGSFIPNGWFNIDNDAGTHLGDPAVAYNPNTDQYLVVYSAELSIDNHDIWGKIVNWNGGLSSRLSIDNRLQLQNDPDVVYNNLENEYLVAYSDWQTSNTANVNLQRLNQFGAAIDSASIASPAGQYRGDPDLFHDAIGNRYLVVYGHEGSTPPRILGKSFSGSLMSLSPEFHYNDDGGYGTNPKIACRNVDCLVTWNGLMDSEVKARRVSLDGTPLGPAGGFELSGHIKDVIHSVGNVALFKPWGYIITWDYFLTTTADKGDVFGILVGFGDDHPMGDSFPIDDRAHYEGKSDLACTPSGTCLFADSHNPVQYPNGDWEVSGRLVFTFRNYIPLAIR